MDLNDPERSTLQLASGVQSDRLAAQEEEANDEDEEYYPGSIFGITLPWQRVGRGVNPDAETSLPIFRSRGVRQVHPVDGSVELNVGASTPSGSATSTATTTNASQSSSSSSNSNGQVDVNGRPVESPDIWYTLTAFVLFYCLYIFCTS